jgi:two-component system chemotaxis sensor kinase CheA
MPGERTLIYEFVSEAKEHLGNLADDLLALEQAPEDARRFRIDRSFRAVHSVKGGAGFFGCQAVETLAHALETVLNDLRQGSLPPASNIIDGLLAGTDRLLALLDDIEHSNQADLGDLLARLRSLVACQTLEPPPVRSDQDLAPIDDRAAFDFSELPLAKQPAGEKFIFGVKIDRPRSFSAFRPTGPY